MLARALKVNLVQTGLQRSQELVVIAGVQGLEVVPRAALFFQSGGPRFVCFPGYREMRSGAKREVCQLLCLLPEATRLRPKLQWRLIVAV